MNIRIKETVIALTLCLVSLNTYAQSNDELIEKFYLSIGRAIRLPDNKSSCTMIKIEVSKLGYITDIALSDSADSLFNSAFILQKKALDLESIWLYIKRNKIKKTALLLPFYISFQHGPTIPFTQSRQFMQFKKRDFLGKAIILKPGEIQISEDQ